MADNVRRREVVASLALRHAGRQSRRASDDAEVIEVDAATTGAKALEITTVTVRSRH
jgi:hypothetical protein